MSRRSGRRFADKGHAQTKMHVPAKWPPVRRQRTCATLKCILRGLRGPHGGPAGRFAMFPAGPEFSIYGPTTGFRPMEDDMAVSTAKQQNSKPGTKHNIEAMREAFYERISEYDMAPLWKVMKNVVTKEPVTHCVPALWRFDDAKSLVLESGPLITAEEAERRVLILENPAMRGQSKITNSMFAGIQMILPGEVAPAHQHVSSAIRFVLDGEGAYTAVEGEKTIMAPGDFVITSNWAPHDHGNDSKEPMMWLDVLDFPMVNFFETSFAQQFAEKTQPTGRGDGDSLAFYGSGVLPDSVPARRGRPWARTSRCCRPASRASHTARPTVPCSCASRARAPPKSATRRSNGG